MTRVFGKPKTHTCQHDLRSFLSRFWTSLKSQVHLFQYPLFSTLLSKARNLVPCLHDIHHGNPLEEDIPRDRIHPVLLHGNLRARPDLLSSFPAHSFVSGQP